MGVAQASAGLARVGTAPMSGMKRRKGGSLGERKGTESASSRRQDAQDAMRASGHEGDVDKQRRNHEALQGETQKAFQELVQWIMDFFE